MTKILITEEQLNLIKEECDAKPRFNLPKLKNYAKGINLVCNGEYGHIFIKEDEVGNNNEVFVCLGDLNPFDESALKDFLLEVVCYDYKDHGCFKITIENEAMPPQGKGWKIYNIQKDKFLPY